ncbi:ERCC4 domain-containing protein [Scatolibacter rhodanostii]|uniref:ERCC4 domain-containing protein n=1 Tax=Scatolibacter rhodanostii TaxID=2014781 RepID=UPI000C0868DD|nr:ERCC4 domain-containing protein [Scatolibacter rhodanostii]
MDIFEIKYALEHITILVDTREQDTSKFRKRLKAMQFPYERKKLNFGDYSVKCRLPDGTDMDFSNIVCVERKMSLDEMASCFGTERKRFTKEFERAKQAGAKLYLLIEDASWEKAYEGAYRSKMHPSAFTASMQAWLARYNCQLLFCTPETSGKLIGDILYREVKERLENG